MKSINQYDRTFRQIAENTDDNFFAVDKAEQSFPFTKAKYARGFLSASRSGGYAVSRQIFLPLRCERIYRENLASDRPMQEKPLQTETTAPPPADRKGKIIYGELEFGKCRNDNRKFRMFGTLGKVSITGSLSQVGIMKILIIERSITLPLPYMFTRTWQGMF